MNKHPACRWTAGDDWQINATLLDENGDAFDLTAVEIKWALMSEAWQRLLSEDDVVISVTDAVGGKCSISVPAAKTSPLLGSYTDYIRIIHDGITSTLSYGEISVERDPWAAPEAAATARQSLRVA
jgi:hypothetical protein